MQRAAGSEREFLERLKQRFGRMAPPAPAGIGDDAAVMKLRPGPGGGNLLLATDCLIESRHFLRSEPAFLIGRKSLAVNLSDLAAMGATAVGFLLTLGLPSSLPPRFLDRLIDGLASAAARHRCPLLGGDTSGADELVISIVVVGRSRGVLTRFGARPGDGLYVSGGLGASAAGRALLSAGWRPRLDRAGEKVLGAIPPRSKRKGAVPLMTATVRRAAAAALAAHLDPVPRLVLGQTLLRRGLATSAIDLSDGLSSDLHRLAEASGVGVRLFTHAVPLSDAARWAASAIGADPRVLALDGGEDYELLFTSRPGNEAALSKLGALPIGRIVPRRAGVRLAEPGGSTRELPRGGFDHFSRG